MMSAIAGLRYWDDRAVTSSDVRQMIEALSHRGPHGAGSWVEGATGLGHCMLWTTPESISERLPTTNPTGDLALTADARVDNRGDLINMLGLADQARDGIADSQLIMAAYEAWGEECTRRLVGDFVFVIWDGRKQRLFCARDPLGIKPFYYYASNDMFVFASEIKGLFSVSGVRRRLNELRIAEHLIQFFEDKASTYFADVFRLPAGHSMIVDRSGTRMERYWFLDPSKELRLSSDDAYAEAFRDIFTEAVSCRLRSAYPIGSALSGGLDSSSIACCARDLLASEGDQTLHTFSAVFSGLPDGDLKRIDERHYIDTVLATGGFEPHFVHAGELNPLGNLDQVLWRMDEPFLAPNLYMHWALYKCAQQAGSRVFLDGIDGDTAVSYGLERLADLARTGRWRTLIYEAKAFSRNVDSSLTPSRVVWRYGFKPIMPTRAVDAWRRFRGRHQTQWPLMATVSQELAQRTRLSERNVKSLEDGRVGLRTAREKHVHELDSGLISYALELLDKAAAAFRIEPRYPYFDRRFIEFCVALPSAQKLSGGWPRIIQRRAMDGMLPPEVQWRFTKADLSPNFQRRLLECERGALEELLYDRNGILGVYADVPSLRVAFQRYAANPVWQDQDALTVYGAVVLAQWLRRSGFTAADDHSRARVVK